MKRRGKFIAIGSAFALTCGFLGGVALHRPSSDFPKNSAGPEVSIVIASGEFGSSIASQLHKQGVIKSAATFISLISKDPRGMSIAAGAHRVHTHIPVSQALAELLEKARNAGTLEVKEGSTYQDVVSGLKRLGVDFSKSATKKPYLKNSYNSLEGQLSPAIYSFAPKSSLQAALSAMLAKFQSEATSSGLLSGYLSYSPYEVLKVASMVQIEGDPSDFAKVSRVIYNRLKIGMPLQLNSTVQYAANYRGKIALSRNQTKIDSPYNTYIHVGLPPTPISNPSALAITASLKPATGNWLYFITVAPHDTRFTNNFAIFQDWNALYNKNLAAGRFK